MSSFAKFPKIIFQMKYENTLLLVLGKHMIWLLFSMTSLVLVIQKLWLAKGDPIKQCFFYWGTVEEEQRSKIKSANVTDEEMAIKLLKVELSHSCYQCTSLPEKSYGLF